MSQPKQRELDAVSRLPMLGQCEVATLYQVLGVLGFDLGIIALFMEKSEDEVKTLFRLGVSSGHKLVGTFLTGCELARWCNRIHLRPGVVQQRLNFDESKLQHKKQGHSSTLVPAAWVGPPLFAVKGSQYEGRAFVELAGLVSMPPRSAPNSAVMSQIEAGKYPLRLPQLRDLMMAIEAADLTHPKVEIIENALAQFPKGVRTPEEVLEALSTEDTAVETKGLVATVEIQSSSTTVEESTMRVHIIDRFRAEIARRELLPVLRNLHGASPEIRALCHEWSIDVWTEVFPGQLEAMLSSVEFRTACTALPQLTNPLKAMGAWLADARQAEAQSKLPVTKAAKPLPLPKPAVVTPVPPPRVGLAAKPVSPPVTVRPALPSVPVIPAAIQVTALKEADQYGLVWDLEKGTVTLGVVTIPLDPIPDARRADGVRTASRRVYDTLYAIHDAFNLDWDHFCGNLSMSKGWFANLSTSVSRVSPQVVRNVLVGLEIHYNLVLTPEELLGLKALSLKGAPADEKVVVDGVHEWLFPIGDKLTGYRFASLLSKYRAVLHWFHRIYGVTDEHIMMLEKGEISVPLAVHYVLLWKVRERIESSEDVVIPRAYEWFLDQPRSQPVRDGSFVLDENAIPCLKWLRPKGE